MQTPKKRNESCNLNKNEPSNLGRRAPPITPPARRKISLDGSESSSPHAVKTPTNNRSPKVAEHKSPRTSVSKSPTVPEKKRPSKVTTLESQVSKLQEDLKKTKDLLDASESQRVQAELDAQEAKKQSTDAVQKLEDAQQQLKELTESGDARVQELNKIGLERDTAWQAEVEVLREKQSADSAALSSALSEVQMLKLQLEAASNTGTCVENQVEVTDEEIQDLKEELAKVVALVDMLKAQVSDSEKAEEEYQMLVSETQVQLEVATGLIHTLRSNGQEANKAFNCVVSELEKSRAHVAFLEERARDSNSNQVVEVERPTAMELNSLQTEINQLKAALDDADKRYQEQQMKHALEIQSVHEELNDVKAQSSVRETELATMLKDTKAESAELRANLAEKDAQMQGIISTREKLNSVKEGCQESESESEWETKLQNSMVEVSELKSRLADKDAEVKTVLEENERLKLSIKKKEAERSGSYETAIAERDLARAAEQEAMVKMGIVTEEADKNSRRAARISEQLEATQAANAEMEAELRRIKIQSDQWRKAAEAAAAILSNGKNGEMERSGSYNPNYNSLGGKLLNSPFSDEPDDESPKKKGNVFKKFGGMWKKGQK